ncbi:GNAT family N-acetyltransferase [Nocardia sp. ET3-3]|uniref:GNAT family N-acetyltransferase n=1 Tax=Nocardia terrae TaxID=2675851 RepID=A0A7K1UTB7_9NOCA|nr:GNAT family N-acetyltransferase [Nocardia terrae]MVU77531.1 GNAT family N-acetyltransferase [Nocardia terrae]
MHSPSTPRADIELRELSGARAEDVELLRRFYRECYEVAFPDPDERESLANMESYLKLKEQGWYGANNYHIVIASLGGGIVGGSVCDYLAEPNAGVIEYLLVQPGLRESGLGSRLLAAIERLCRTDAALLERRELDWLVAETEDPYRNAVPAEGFDTFVRARIMAGLGFRIMDFRYVQPALSDQQEPAENLLLIARPVAGKPDAIGADVVLSIVSQYMRWAMRIEHPLRNREFRGMARALTGRRSIGLVEFAEYLGWDTELRTTEVTDVRDPALSEALDVYESAYSDPGTAWPRTAFRSAVQQGPALAAAGFHYHLWALHRPPQGPCDGMVSFVTMPSAGFGGYLAFGPPLRGSGRLRPIIARIEERMIRDNPQARAWFIECATDLNREIFCKAGFFEVDAAYEQPGSADGRRLPLRLHLLYKPFGRTYEPPVIERAVFLEAIAEIYHVVYQLDPETNASFARLTDSLRDCDSVRTWNKRR